MSETYAYSVPVKLDNNAIVCEASLAKTDDLEREVVDVSRAFYYTQITTAIRGIALEMSKTPDPFIS